MRQPGWCSLPVLLLAVAALPAAALEWGLSASAGTGFWSGAWSASAESFSDDFGQTPSVGFFPAGTLQVDAAFSPEKAFHYAVSAGVGTWGGRIHSSGGTSPDRTSSVAAVGAELVPGARFRFRAGKAVLGAEARLGFGLLLSPVWAIEAWPSTTTTAAYRVEAIDLGYLCAGASLAWHPPAGALRWVLLLNADAALATFDAAAETGSPILLTRLGLGVRVSGNGAEKKAAAR